jgi:hypothetical protein
MFTFGWNVAVRTSADIPDRVTERDNGDTSTKQSQPEVTMLLIVAIVLLIIAIAGGVIIHPLLFLLAILALVAFFAGR